MNMEMHRRQFTQGLIGIAAASLLAGASQAAAAASAPGAAAMQSAQHIGKAYLRLRPAESNREWLRTSLSHGLQQTGATLSDEDGALGLGEGLRALVKDDFASGRTIILDGWVLSESECRLCALHVIA